MSNRLDCIYNLIPKASHGVADIGTDHGIIPVRLIQNGFSNTVVASDLRQGPLDKAIQAAEELNISDRINFLLTNGLQGIEKYDIDTIVIAGMGGETITSILDTDYWCCAPGYTLILQPMTQTHILRFWLTNNEFKITQELLVKDEDKIYNIMMVNYGVSPSYTDAELYTGKYEQIVENSLFSEYLDQMIHKFEIRVKGQSLSTHNTGDKNMNRVILKQLHDMKERFLHES